MSSTLKALSCVASIILGLAILSSDNKLGAYALVVLMFAAGGYGLQEIILGMIMTEPIDEKKTVKWIDRNREPQCAAKPRFPDGIDVDVSDGARRTCTVELPYPAKRCGLYVVDCIECGTKVMCTTAGRADDPRSIKMACKGGCKE